MPRPLLPRCALASLWLVCASATAAPVFVSHDELARRLSARAQGAHIEAVDAARLDDARVRATADPVVGEWALHGLVVALARQEPDDALRARVEALTRFAPQAWTAAADPDHARGARVPVADVAAAARRTLRAWDVATQADALRAAWLRGAAPARAGDSEVVAAALATLDASHLDAVLAAGSDRLPIEALATVAARSRDERVATRVLMRGQGAQSIAFVAGLADREPAAPALAHLRLATRNPALATAACRGLATLAPRAPAARDALFALLDDPQAGPPAAQALAVLGDTETLARIDAALERAARASASGAAVPAPDPRRLLLILQRLPEADGVPRLARFVGDTRHPAALRAEVAGWGPR